MGKKRRGAGRRKCGAPPARLASDRSFRASTAGRSGSGSASRLFVVGCCGLPGRPALSDAVCRAPSTVGTEGGARRCPGALLEQVPESRGQMCPRGRWRMDGNTGGCWLLSFTSLRIKHKS